MNSLLAQQILLDGLILSIGLSVILLSSMAINPRIMRSDYPPQIKEKLPPLSNAEKRQLALTGLLFWGFAVGLFFYSTRSLIARNGSESLFLPVFLNTYLVFEVANLFDLFVLDYLLLIVMRPGFLFIPEAAGMEQYNTFAFHFAGFLKGLVIGVVLSLIVAVVTVALTR